MTITSITPPQQIARLIRQHCEARRIAVSRFGREVVKDPRLFADLRAGRQLRESTVVRISAALNAVTAP